MESEPVNIFTTVLETVAYIQKTYQNNITGEEKKRICEVKVRMLLGDNPDYHAIKDYLPELIDVLVFLAKNKHISKLFKKSCAVCF